MPEPIQTFNPAPSRLALPPGSCDAHVHVFGPAAQFTFSPARQFTLADAGKETLFALHRQLGIARCVIEDAIAAGGGRYLGAEFIANSRHQPKGASMARTQPRPSPMSSPAMLIVFLATFRAWSASSRVPDVERINPALPRTLTNETVALRLLASAAEPAPSTPH